MTNRVDPEQLSSSEAIWSGSTLFAKTGHVVFSKRRVKLINVDVSCSFENPYIVWFYPSAHVSFIFEKKQKKTKKQKQKKNNNKNFKWSLSL